MHEIDFNFDLQIKTKAMRFIKFLSLLEKIIIVVIILCFIPIVIFAYRPRPTTLSTQIQSAYQQIKKQASSSGFLTRMVSGGHCTSTAMLALMNEQCLERCNLDSNCRIVAPTQPCPFANSYIINQTKICSMQTVQNQYVPADTINFIPNQQSLPLSSIEMSSNQTLLFNFYCISSLSQCRSFISFFGQHLQDSLSSNYHTFTVLVQYLMYFGLIPLIVHTIIVFVLDSCCNLNLRLTNSLMIIHEALIGAAIIIAGIFFNLTNAEIQENINKLSTQCLINAPQCQSLLTPLSNFKVDDGVSSTFVTIMCFILAIQALLLIGVVILNILMVKYYKLREIDPSFSGYELQTL